MATSSPDWRRSSRSGATGDNCVEVAAYPGAVLVRDSKQPDGPVLHFAGSAFRAFLHDAAYGAFPRR